MRLVFVLWVQGTCPISSTVSLTNVSLNSRCENFEPENMRMITFLRTVNSRRWNYSFFAHFSLVAFASVVVIEGFACFLSPSDCTVFVHWPVCLRFIQPVIFMPKPECFFGKYFLRMTAFAEHINFNCWMFSWAAIFSLQITETVFSTVCGIFRMSVGFMFVVTEVQKSEYMKAYALS